jgi:hypothetical protein
MDIGELGLGDIGWIVLAQDSNKWRALVNVIMNLQVPENAGRFLSGCITSGLSSCDQVHRAS